jgi:hypothetical protein
MIKTFYNLLTQFDIKNPCKRGLCSHSNSRILFWQYSYRHLLSDIKVKDTLNMLDYLSSSFIYDELTSPINKTIDEYIANNEMEIVFPYKDRNMKIPLADIVPEKLILEYDGARYSYSQFDIQVCSIPIQHRLDRHLLLRLLY